MKDFFSYRLIYKELVDGVHGLGFHVDNKLLTMLRLLAYEYIFISNWCLCFA